MLEKQFLPTLEDVKNNELKNLSRRVKERSVKETLTNIIDWQERNLQYWIDRADMFILLYFLFIISVYLLPIPSNIKIVFIFAFIILALFDIASALSYILPLVGFLIVFFTVLFSVGFPVANKTFTIYQLVGLSIVFGSIISLIVYLLFKYRNIKSFQPEFKLGDTFKLSLSVDKIIKYRLAICRDYAKLTAALLLNLYPKSKIYFVTIPFHVAAAIKINEKIYVLDQRLPVLTLKKWMEFWNERMSKNILFKFLSWILRVIKKGELTLYEIIIDQNIKIEKIESKKLYVTNIPKIETDKLTDKLMNNLNIKQTERKSKADLEIFLENFALCYDKDEIDEIIEFSLIKAIKNKLKNELCGNLSKISKIKITQDKRDLILNVWIK